MVGRNSDIMHDESYGVVVCRNRAPCPLPLSSEEYEYNTSHFNTPWLDQLDKLTYSVSRL